MSERSSAREVALRALVACERQGAWSDGFLKKETGRAGLDGRDAALATRLCFGVLQNRMLLDFWLGGLSKVPLPKMEPAVRGALRLVPTRSCFWIGCPITPLSTRRWSRPVTTAGIPAPPVW